MFQLKVVLGGFETWLKFVKFGLRSGYDKLEKK